MVDGFEKLPTDNEDIAAQSYRAKSSNTHFFTNPISIDGLKYIGADFSSTADYLNQKSHQSNEIILKKELNSLDLIALGIGCTIGAGIFVVTGVVARDKTGPALFLSFIFSGIACLFSAFSYAELASMHPTAGSAYGFTRAALGEFLGWIIGWDLVLEYAITAASVAQGWSKYFNALLGFFDVQVASIVSQAPWAYDPDTGQAIATGSIFDLLAVFITIVMTAILVRGIKESAFFNTVMVALKLSIILFVIVVGWGYMNDENFTPFMPYGFFGLSLFGYTAIGQHDSSGNAVGVLAGAGVVFFAYIGFDAVTTSAEECKNPTRDLPIGIIGSLVISTILYILVSIVLVGMVPYEKIDRDAPLSSAFGDLGLRWAEIIVAIGAIIGLTSVLLVTMLGQPRILIAMSRDGLLPNTVFNEIHPLFHTPYKSTILTGTFVALVSSLVPMTILVEVVSMGTLSAFIMVNISIIVLRKTQPNMPRPFKCPYMPWIPILGALTCFIMMISLPSANWIRLIVWWSIGFTIYYFYGRLGKERLNTSARLDQALHIEIKPHKPQDLDRNQVYNPIIDTTEI